MALGEAGIREATKAATTVAELDSVRVQILGRQGSLTEELRTIGSLPAAERGAAGARLNALRQVAEDALAKRLSELSAAEARQSVAPNLDLTAPGIAPGVGHRHPVTRVLDQLVDIFWQMGYQVADGPEVETDWHIFEALNIPADHPARDMQDTFYLENGLIPRTHTSGIQIRHMLAERDNLPIRIIAPGKVYRNEDEDGRHSWTFHQIEGLVVDEGISLADLKGTLEAMLRGVLGEETKLRLRPNFFPYTEPSVEMDATCSICRGTGQVSGASCKLCSGTGWLELGGAGMVHPQVLRNVGIDPERYSGFAFGFGPERLATIRYGVDDVREFWRPNFRFLEQF